MARRKSAHVMTSDDRLFLHRLRDLRHRRHATFLLRRDFHLRRLWMRNQNYLGAKGLNGWPGPADCRTGSSDLDRRHRRYRRGCFVMEYCGLKRRYDLRLRYDHQRQTGSVPRRTGLPSTAGWRQHRDRQRPGDWHRLLHHV